MVLNSLVNFSTLKDYVLNLHVYVSVLVGYVLNLLLSQWVTFLFYPFTHTLCACSNIRRYNPYFKYCLLNIIKAVELSLHVSTTYVCRDWDSNTQPCGSNAQTHCAAAAARPFGSAIITFIEIFENLTCVHSPMCYSELANNSERLVLFPLYVTSGF